MVHLFHGWFLGYKRLGFVGGVVAGLAAGFGDATLGWFLSIAISPYIRHPPQRFGILIVIITVVMVSTLGLFFGLIGAIVSKLVSGRSSTNKRLQRTRPRQTASQSLKPLQKRFHMFVA